MILTIAPTRIEQLIGIAGGIGSGKSVVSRILRLKGYRVYDCDSEAQRLMSESPALRSGIIEITGDEKVYGAENKINRQRLASILFNDAVVRKRVNGLVHAAVRDDLLSFVNGQPENCPVFVESAIMGSSGLTAMCAEVWIVEAPEQMRIERVMHRNNLPEEEIRKRMIAQDKEEELIISTSLKVERIINDGRSSLLKIIDELLEKTEYNA